MNRCGGELENDLLMSQEQLSLIRIPPRPDSFLTLLERLVKVSAVVKRKVIVTFGR